MKDRSISGEDLRLEVEELRRQVGLLQAEVDRSRMREDRLKESQEHFRQLTEHIEEVLWMVDLREPRVLYVSPAYEGIWGRTCASLYESPQSFLEAIHADDRPRVRADLERQMNGESVVHEYRIVRPDSGVRWVYSRAFPVKGEGQRVVGVAQDITERKQIEEALAKSEKHLRTIIETEPECVKVVALDGTLLEMNPAGLEMIQADSAEQVIGQCVYPLIAPRYREAYRALNERACRGEEGSLEFEIIGCKGGRRWLESHSVPLTDESETIVGALSITRDITQRKRLEEQLLQSQKMEAVGQLAGGMAHDFNNLLTVIKGNCQLLLHSLDESNEWRRDIEDILEASDRGANLVRQLLAFSRRQVLRPEVLDLNGVIADIENILYRTIGEDIELVTLLERDLKPVKVDRAQIGQVLLNLAVNARDAMPRGGRLTIESANAPRVDGRELDLEPGDYVRLSIRDTGIGMGREVQARVFEPFFTTKEVGKGTGLGLSMAYGIVTQSGGTIRVESEPGKGTTFDIYLPQTDQSPWADEQISQVSGPIAGGAETVLVVEDDANVSRVVGALLGDMGYAVLLAGNGEEALRISRQYEKRIDLLLTDLLMPSMNGNELAQRLQQVRPELKVIYMSGYSDWLLEERGVSGKPLHLLEKPFNLMDMAARVRKVLDS